MIDALLETLSMIFAVVNYSRTPQSVVSNHLLLGRKNAFDRERLKANGELFECKYLGSGKHKIERFAVGGGDFYQANTAAIVSKIRAGAQSSRSSSQLWGRLGSSTSSTALSGARASAPFP